MKVLVADPFEPTGGVALHYEPGNEYRARVGLDHALGTGRFVVGVTYSTFGDDNLSGSLYNTGNRIISQFGLSDTFGPGQISISGWDLYRASGTQAGGSDYLLQFLLPRTITENTMRRGFAPLVE